MSQTTDGIDSTARQHGAKVLRLPLQEDGNAYATEITRTMMAVPASAYDPIIGERTGYTQLLKYSDDFSNAAWTKAAATGTANATTDTEGTTTATKLAEDNTNAAHNASQALVIASGALSFGILAKAAERSFVRLRLNNGTDGNLAVAVFNLSTGAVLSGTGTIKKLLNGWYWCYVTGTATISNSTAYVDLTSDGSTFSYTGTTGSGVYLWKATAFRSSTMGPAVLTTSATRAVTVGPIDPDDPLAFLVNEQEPDASALEIGYARWLRTYANVPAQTIVPSWQLITKPSIVSGDPVGYITDLTTQGLGGSLFGPISSNIYPYGQAFYGGNTFYSKASGTISRAAVTAGTLTLSYRGQTTSSLNWNDSGSTIATALNGLSTAVSDGLTFSVTNNLATLVLGPRLVLTLTAGTTQYPVTMNAASLTTTGAAKAYTWVFSSALQLISMGATVTITAHGFDEADPLAVYFPNQAGVTEISQLYLLPANYMWDIVNANSITMHDFYASNQANIASYWGQPTGSYSSGTVLARIREVTDYYLPGFTPGISTQYDVPLPTLQGDDESLISAILAGTTEINWEVGKLQRWKGFDILARTIVKLNPTEL